MSRLPWHRPGRRALSACVVLAVCLGSAVAMAGSAGAVPPVGPNPPTPNVSINVSTPTDGLVNGDDVNFTVNTSGGASLFAVEAHLCQTGLSGYTNTNFQYNDTTAARCVRSAGIISGGLASADYKIGPFSYSGDTTSGLKTFNAGTGTVNWSNSVGQTNTITCDVTNPCDLVVKVDINQSPNTTYFIQTLTYAGAPGAPTGVVATPGDTQVGVSWTAPASNGNSPLDRFTVSATGPGCSPCTVNTPNGTTTNATVTGLTNFASYDFTVTARNAAGFTGPASSPAVSASPGPPGPTGVSGSPANQSVVLSWTFAGSPVGLSEFRITPYTEPGHVAQAPVFTGSTVTNATVTGLTNGTQYTFTVAARYGVGQFTAESAPSGVVVPQGKFITQTINVTRPNGDLVLTQACAGSDPYPDDLNTVVYPTNCTVNLGTAKLIKTGPGAGQYFRATGALNQITVVDTRDADPGWNVTGLTTPFVDGTKTFSCNNLGWDPAPPDDTEPFTSPDGSYNQIATEGGVIAPGTFPNGLCTAKPFATSAAGSGLGIAYLDASLELWIPVFKPAGNYSSVFTITAA